MIRPATTVAFAIGLILGSVSIAAATMIGPDSALPICETPVLVSYMVTP